MRPKATPSPEAQAYLEHLAALPFVRKVEMVAQAGRPLPGVALTAQGQKYGYEVRILRTHLSLPEVARAIGLAQSQPKSRPLLLLAPYVSGPMGARLREAGVQYVDQAGNLHVQLASGRKGQGALVALVEGKRSPRAKPSDTAWRAPSYQVLLALLAQPPLVAAPLRTIALAAGVSTSPVLQVQKKLIESGWMVEERGARRLTPRGKDSALGLWLAGYHTTLRPQLVVGRFRPRGSPTTEELEAQVGQSLRGKLSFWWGGAAAAHRLDGYYRGERTALHVDGEAPTIATLANLLRMVPSPDGPVEVLRLPGHAALEATRTDVVHPLLAWAELLEEGHDRAIEAAQRLERRWKP
ncbi:MAG: hypothetical protein RL385_3094 [Pseudomonadota bacterium]|jgi:hypothetical protein